MKKAAFIIPYFGKFNNYFQLFLNSCKFNEDYDWIIFTDDKTDYNYPNNIKVNYIEFEELKKLFQSKFDFEIELSRPYKLCDYKVSYGYVFEEYLKEYLFWGHCDTDLIFGRINDFITSNDLEKYEKIGILGHFTLYKNTKENNRMFMQKINNLKRYKEVFKDLDNNSFDEEFNNSINNIYLNCGKSIKQDINEANIYTKSSNFKLVKMNLENHMYEVERNKKAFFIWDNGRLYRYEKRGKEIKRNEFLYIHMQSRKMKINNLSNKNKYKIIPNCFENLETEKIDFKNIKIKHFNLHYFILRSKNLKMKLKRRIKR